MFNFRVVYYKVIKGIKGTMTVCEGDYNHCLEFYIKHKEIYIQDGKYLEIISY